MLNFKQKKNAFIYGFTHAFNGDILGATRLKSLDENIKDFKEKSTQKLRLSNETFKQKFKALTR